MSAARSFTIIGNPENRRVTMYQAALARNGYQAARVIRWLDLVEPGAPAKLLADLGDTILRIDSAGENAELERMFIQRGEPAARRERCEAIDAKSLAAIPDELGRILYPRQQHLGFVAVLDEIAAAIPPATRVLQPVPAIVQLFDKSACARAWRPLGIPMPDVLEDVRDPDDLRARMEQAEWRSVFVKQTAGSSASCLAVFVHDKDGEHVMTTVEDTGDARYNTRRIQRLGTRERIDRVLGFILNEGAQVERAIPKAKLDRRYFDLRVLVVAGEPAFIVVRTSEHPITNLHLGGQRGNLDAVRARVPDDAWEAAMASCRRVQAQTGAFHVGIDLMFEPDFTRHRVIEGNAFGDLLPNLERDGLDVYGWQIKRALDT